MSGFNGSVARTLAIVAAAGLSLVGEWSPASAAGLGGDCCADLDQRIADLEATVARKGRRGEKIELKITGVVSHAILYWDDGGRRDAYVVGSAQDGNSLAFKNLNHSRQLPTAD